MIHTGNPRPTSRWRATITYRSENGPIDVDHYIEEIDELHDIVERGPHWDTIREIRVVKAEREYNPITLEQARKL